MSKHNKVTTAVAIVIAGVGLTTAGIINNKKPQPSPQVKIITIEKPVIIEKRVEVPAPTKTPVPTTRTTPTTTTGN